MNCEKCSTPMLWIGTMSRGGLDCPKCAAKRPIVFDMGCKTPLDPILPAGFVTAHEAGVAAGILRDSCEADTWTHTFDAETLRKASEMALLEDAMKLGIIAAYTTDTVPDFRGVQAPIAAEIGCDGYWVAVTLEGLRKLYPKYVGSNERLLRDVAHANHTQATTMRNEEDDRIARLTVHIPCADELEG